jgi:hypothetical protein
MEKFIDLKLLVFMVVEIMEMAMGDTHVMTSMKCRHFTAY